MGGVICHDHDHFSDLEWVVVTDVSLQQIEEALRKLQKWCGDMLNRT